MATAAVAQDPAGPSEKCPSPAEVVARAKASRVEYIKVIADVQRFVPNMSTSEELYAHVMILDQLEKIGAGYGVDLLGGSPVADLGVLLTRNAIKWIRLDSDDPALLRIFFVWAENSTRFSAAQQQTRFLYPLSDKKDLLLWHAKIRVSLDQMIELKADSFVVQAFDELQGTTVRKLISLKKDLTFDEKMTLINETKSVASLQEVLDFLAQEVLQAKDPQYLKHVMVWSIQLGKNLKTLKQTIPFHLLASPGSIVNDSVVNLLVADEPIDPKLVPDIIDALMPTQLGELGGRLTTMYSNRLIPDRMVPFLYELTGAILKKWAQLGMKDRVRELARLHQRLALLKLQQ
jgi:hypothetical protein